MGKIVDISSEGSGVISSHNLPDHVMIRGRMLALDGLISQDISDKKRIAADRDAFLNASPFPHLVQEGLFDPELLNLILEEFPSGPAGLRTVQTASETTMRSRDPGKLGPAAQIYFNLIHSNAFVEYLSAISGINHLIVDHSLMGGGLHETRKGGKFDIHCDFNMHRQTLLTNQLVLITYLNEDWDEDFGGALELWDAHSRTCDRAVLPIFGRTILFANSRTSYHGHPAPLAAPPDRYRRSIAAYYYSADEDAERRGRWRSSVFLSKVKGDASKVSDLGLWIASAGPRKRRARLLRSITPPVFWYGMTRASVHVRRMMRRRK